MADLKVILEKLYDEYSSSDESTEAKEALISWKNIICGNNYDYTLDEYLTSYITDQLDSVVPVTENQLINEMQLNAVNMLSSLSSTTYESPVTVLKVGKDNTCYLGSDFVRYDADNINYLYDSKGNSKSWDNEKTYEVGETLGYSNIERSILLFLSQYNGNRLTLEDFIPSYYTTEKTNISKITVDDQSPSSISDEDLYNKFGFVEGIGRINFESHPKASNVTIDTPAAVYGSPDDAEAAFEGITTQLMKNTQNINNLLGYVNGTTSSYKKEQLIWRQQGVETRILNSTATSRNDRILINYSNNGVGDSTKIDNNSYGHLPQPSNSKFFGIKVICYGGTEAYASLGTTVADLFKQYQKVSSSIYQNALNEWQTKFKYDGYFVGHEEEVYYGKLVLNEGWVTPTIISSNYFRSGQCFYCPTQQKLYIDWRPLENSQIRVSNNQTLDYVYRVGRELQRSIGDYSVGDTWYSTSLTSSSDLSSTSDMREALIPYEIYGVYSPSIFADGETDQHDYVHVIFYDDTTSYTDGRTNYISYIEPEEDDAEFDGYYDITSYGEEDTAASHLLGFFEEAIDDYKDGIGNYISGDTISSIANEYVSVSDGKYLLNSSTTLPIHYNSDSILIIIKDSSGNFITKFVITKDDTNFEVYTMSNPVSTIANLIERTSDNISSCYSDLYTETLSKQNSDVIFTRGSETYTISNVLNNESDFCTSENGYTTFKDGSTIVLQY